MQYPNAEERIKETQEEIEKWVGNPSNRPNKIGKWTRFSKSDFKKIAEKLVKAQTRWDTFEGGTGQVDKIHYGMVKFKVPYTQPWEEGIIVIYTESIVSGLLGGEVGVLGFAVNPFTKKLMAVSLYDDSRWFVEHRLETEEKDSYFYFGSTEYTIPSPLSGGFDRFSVPVGKKYQKYLAIVQKIWADYLTSIQIVVNN